MLTENKRLEFLDALKGFAILLVVAGHWMIRLGLSGYDNILWTFIVSVHLPLFFFVSGFFTEGKTFGFSTLTRRAKSLLIPGIIFFSLYMVSKGTTPLSVIKYGFQEYWFTFVLFEMYLIYFLCVKCFNKYKYIALVICSILGVAYLITPTIRSGQINTILCLENLTKYFQFFTLGIIFRKYKTTLFTFLKKDWTIGSLIVTYIVSFLLCFNTDLESHYSIIYKSNHDLVFRYLGVLLILAFFLYMEEFFKSNKIGKSFIFLGQRTLDIYLIHYFFLPTILLMPDYLKSNSMWYIQLLILLILSTIVIGGCIIVSNIIRMSPSLSSLVLGTRKREN